MNKSAARAREHQSPAASLGGLVARLIAGISTVLHLVLPGATPKARYERRHRPLAGPRPGARLG